MNPELAKTLLIGISMIGMSIVLPILVNIFIFRQIIELVGFDSFIVTPRLIQISQLLIGSSFDLKRIEEINQGIIDLVAGNIVEKISGSGSNGLVKISIRTNKGNIVTVAKIRKIPAIGENPFLCKIIFRAQSFFSPERIVLRSIGDLSLIDQASLIYVKDLDLYSEIIDKAFNYGKKINFIYNRLDDNIILFQLIHSKNRNENIIISPSSARDKDEINSSSLFDIKLNFKGKFLDDQKNIFYRAAKRWEKIIRNDLQPININGEHIVGLLISVRSIENDGPSGILAQGRPTHLRPDSLLPAMGEIEIDSADLDLASDILQDIAVHEIAHVLGFGTLWELKGLVRQLGTNNPSYIGQNAMREYANLLGRNHPVAVPIENNGPVGSRYSHWRESVFGGEIMSTVLDTLPSPISRITLAALEDLGYTCDFKEADLFYLPTRSNSLDNSSKRRCQCHKTTFSHNDNELLSLTFDDFL